MYLPREEENRLFKMTKWKEALVLIGPRRGGKTSLALRMLEIFEKTGGTGKYFDLEAIGAPSSALSLAEEISKVPEGGLIVLDEIQVVPGWIKVVRGEVEQGKRKILASGSSASLLSKEIASSLGGRAVPETIFPLSYRDAKAWGLKSVMDYLKTGGYPECVLRPSEAARLHKLYLELTVLRDVAARKAIREAKPLSDLALLLLSEPGKTISAKKTSERIGISQPTFRSFVEALNDAFLILSVPPFLRSPRERIVADARHYAYDTGLQASVSISVQDDFGRRVENIVALELVRRGYSLSYLKGADWECDFIAQKAGSPNLAVQVWGGEGKIPEREIRGLVNGVKQIKGEGLLISMGGVETPFGIMAKKLEDWLLET
jgi:predicted AAA+ superfamily ATPase